MKVKCWSCGAENGPENQWCESCAARMTDTRDGEIVKLTAPGNLTRLLSNIGRMIIKSSVLALAAMGMITAVVGVYDFIAAHRILVGIGEILFWTGIVLIFSSFVSGRADPKSMIITGYSPKRTRPPMYAVFQRTIITPLLKTMRHPELSMDKNMHAIQMITGLIILAAGSCLVLLLS